MLFYSVINVVIPSTEGDILLWTGAPNGLFSVKDACLHVDALSHPSSWCNSKSVRKIASPKVNLFMWQAVRDKILTKANLQRRGVVLEYGVCVLFVV